MVPGVGGTMIQMLIEDYLLVEIIFNNTFLTKHSSHFSIIIMIIITYERMVSRRYNFVLSIIILINVSFET